MLLEALGIKVRLASSAPKRIEINAVPKGFPKRVFASLLANKIIKPRI